MLLSRLIFNLEHHVAVNHYSTNNILQLRELLGKTYTLMQQRIEQDYAHWTALTVATVFSCSGVAGMWTSNICQAAGALLYKRSSEWLHRG